ncbi:hypothetical protein [Choristoneura diversana nucleopolyhedrovirus]|nr:hypothetical protein [Choristoneura diversana nucleopolyhedrovirus]
MFFRLKNSIIGNRLVDKHPKRNHSKASNIFRRAFRVLLFLKSKCYNDFDLRVCERFLYRTKQKLKLNILLNTKQIFMLFINHIS